MTIGQAFDAYFKDIEVSPEEAGRAQTLQRTVRAHLEARMSDRIRRSFFVGSFARGTAVRPLSDVDVFLELKEALYPKRRADGPKALLDQLVVELQRAYPTQGAQIRPQAHSVKLQLPGHSIALDLIPAFPRDPGESASRTQGYEIPEREPTNQWLLTFPDAHAEACKAANTRAGGMLNQLIKAVKHWNRAHEARHGGQKPLRSFHLELLCYRAFDRKPDSISTGLAALFRHLADHVTDPCPPPAGKQPDVAAYLAKDENRRNWVRRALDAAVKSADQAVAFELRQRSETNARRAWRNLLGERFPH